MSAIDLTEAIAITAIRGVLQSVLPSGIEIVRGLGNAVGEPVGPDFVVLTPLLRTRLATNVEVYHDGLLPGGNGVEARYTAQATRLTVQCDTHGPNAGDNAQVVATMWRDRWAAEYFETAGTNGLPATAPPYIAAAALYATDPRQIPFITGEAAYEERWSVDLSMQINPTVQFLQQFAAALVVGIISVDTLS